MSMSLLLSMLLILALPVPYPCRFERPRQRVSLLSQGQAMQGVILPAPELAVAAACKVASACIAILVNPASLLPTAFSKRCLAMASC